jgi:hypothetical protein
LLLRKRWAEYVTLAVTASFIPLELYEILRHPDAIRVAIGLVNVTIVWYLARGLARRMPDVGRGVPSSGERESTSASVKVSSDLAYRPSSFSNWGG